VRGFECPNAGSCHWQSLMPICNVHTKISVCCPAGSIGLSFNDSAPDPVGTAFLLLGGFKSSVQLPITCKSETATLSGCVRSILFFSLGDHSRSLHITLVASRLPNLDRYAINSRCDCENPTRPGCARFLGHSHHSGSESRGISSRLLCPHVDSSPGIQLIVHFNKSLAPLAIFFLQMYLGAQSAAGVRMVSRMHYRHQHCRSNGNLKSIIGKDVVRCGGASRTRSIVAEAQGANTVAYLRI